MITKTIHDIQAEWDREVQVHVQQVEEFTSLKDRLDELTEATMVMTYENPIQEELNWVGLTYGTNYQADEEREMGNRGDHWSIIEHENKVSGLEEIRDEVVRLSKHVDDMPGARKKWIWLTGYLATKIEDAKEMVFHHENQSEPMPEAEKRDKADKWEKGHITMEYVQDHFRKWDYHTLCKWNIAINKRNQLPKGHEDRLMFPHWVACRMMLEYGLAKRAYNPTRSKAEYKKFLEMYHEYNLEEQLNKDKYSSYNDEYDPSAKYFGNVAFQHHKMADFCDVMARIRTIATNNNLSIQEVLECELEGE